MKTKLALLSVLLWGATLYSQANSSWRGDTISFIPYYTTQLMLNDSLMQSLSPEARAIISRPSIVITDEEEADTLPFSYLFVPLVFDLSKLVGLPTQADYERLVPAPSISTTPLPSFTTPILSSGLRRQKYEMDLAREVISHLLLSRSDLVRTTSSMLPTDRISTIIAAEGYNGELALESTIQIDKGSDTLEKQRIERRYWTHLFEGNIHASQNNISDNWHKGGNSSLNLNMRNYLNLSYARDNVKWVNELESKIGFYKTPDDESNQYKISEDMFRIVSNYGLRASTHWYYTVELQLRSQVLRNVKSDGTVVTRPFAPLSVNGGPGMKYELNKRYKNNPFRHLNFSANISPVSASLIYTYSDDIDKGRIGLKPEENHKLRIGSTLRASLNYTYSQTVSWQSRLYFNTSWQHLESEFENTLVLAFTNNFSTRLNLNLRFDDSVIVPEKSFRKLLQYNQLLSFGFTYRL